MKVNICGIQHTIIECDDHFDVDTHMGMIDYNKAEIRINKASAQPIKDATICHEVLHGLLVHIGRTDLSTDESFVTALGNAINGAFVLRGERMNNFATDINVGGTDMISRKAAIEALTKDKKALDHIINGMSGHEKEFDRFLGQRNQVDYDIYEIEQLPPANCSEFPNNSDTISRQASIEALDKRFDSIPMEQTTEILLLRKDLRDLPTAEPQRIKGKWALQSDDYHEYYECDQCGIAVGIDDIRNFCPNCGADMREVTE